MKETDERLQKALRSLFVPLANVLLKNQVGIAPVIEQLKIAYVEAAHKNHGKSGKPASINHIALLTGMSRRHVSGLLREALQKPNTDEIAQPVEAGILGRWINSAEFTDDLGNPKALEPGPGPGSLHELVGSSIGPNEVQTKIEDLLKVGNIRMRDDGRLEMVERTFPVHKDLPKCIAVALTSPASVVDHNWGIPVSEKYFQRVSHTIRLNPQKAAIVRRIAKERALRFIEEIDDVLSSYEIGPDELPVNDKFENSARIGVGAFYFEVKQ